MGIVQRYRFLINKNWVRDVERRDEISQIRKFRKFILLCMLELGSTQYYLTDCHIAKFMVPSLRVHIWYK